jgi:hypothetical protein
MASANPQPKRDLLEISRIPFIEASPSSVIVRRRLIAFGAMQVLDIAVPLTVWKA